MSFIYIALKKLSFSLMLMLILLISLISFLITTKAGLYLSVKLAGIFLPGHLVIENLNGRLIDKVDFKKLTYKDKKVDIELDDFALNWQFKALFHPKIIIHDLNAKTLRITLKPPPPNESTTNRSNFKLPLAIQIDRLAIDEIQIKQGRAQYLIEQVKLRSNFTKDLLEVNTLNFNIANLNFGLEGNMKPYYPYAINGDLVFGLTNTLGLPLKGQLKLKGDSSLYYWEGKVDPLNLHVHGTLNNLQDINTLLQWNKLTWPLNKTEQIKSSEGSLKVIGRLPSLKIELKSATEAPIASDVLIETKTSKVGMQSTGLIHINNNEMNLNVDVDNHRNPKIKAKVYANNLKGLPKNMALDAIQLKANLSANTQQDAILLGELEGMYSEEKLKANFRYEQNKIKGDIFLGNNTLTINGTPPYQWQLKGNIPNPKLLDKRLKGLDTAIKIDGFIKKANEGKLTLFIAPGSFQLPDDTEAKRLDFKGGKLTALLDSKILNIKGLFTIDKQKTLSLTALLPQFTLDKGLTPTQKMSLNLTLLVNSLNFLESINPLIAKVDGQLQVALKADGKINKPNLNGTINLTKGLLVIPSLGLNLNPIRLDATSSDKTWQAKGEIAHEGKRLQINGTGSLQPNPVGKINIVGDHFPIIKTEEYLIYISPNLALNFAKDNIELTGNILVPEAQLKPQTFNATINLSEDAVYLTHEATPPPNPLHLKTNINIEMGDKVFLDVKGLHGSLIGGIQIQQAPLGPLNASGELKVNEGKYQAYGQDLEIEQGELIFTGGLITNPGIHVRAVRNISNTTSNLANTDSLFNFNAANLQTLDSSENTTVGIEVNGRLKSPKVRLFSSSAGLSQADILSLLILGKPASQANEASGQLLLNAISALHLDSGASGLQLIDQLKQTTGLDINIKSKSSYNQQTNQFTDSNAVVIGKSLSKRLYLSYNYGLTQSDVNVLTLTYLLNKFFSIQVNASVNASGIDLLYTKPKE